MAIEWDNDPKDVKDILANAYGQRAARQVAPAGTDGVGPGYIRTGTVLTISPLRKSKLQEKLASLSSELLRSE